MLSRDSSSVRRRSSRITTLVSVFSIALGLLTAACGSNAAQKTAFERAVKMEQQLSSEHTTAIIAEYQQVIRIKPGSAYAKKAEERVTALEAKAKAEELHKSVFQEHGVD